MSVAILDSSAICLVDSTSLFEYAISIDIPLTYLEPTIWLDVDVRASSIFTIFELPNVDVSTTVYVYSSSKQMIVLSCS